MYGLNYKGLRSFFTLGFIALVISLTSVFLVGMVSPAKVNASEEPTVALFNLPANVSPLQENQVELDHLKIDFKTKAQMIEDKKNEVEQVKEEVAEVAEKKEQIASQVSSLKNEVAELKAKLAEKKRLEALRIVAASRNADDSAGNTYAAGNCTWYVKSRRPDLSNSLGDANTWFYRAQSMGYNTGTMAKTGAIGTTTRGWLGHVVYVEKWLGDGKILISEMNYSGLYSTRDRIADESEFVYIYNLP